MDESGNVYVAGSTLQPGLLTTTGVPQPQKATNDLDAFVMKFNPATATVVYATYLGGNDTDQPTGIAVDQQGKAIISGSTSSSDFPLVNVQGPFGGVMDAFIAKNPSGSRLTYSTYLGGKPRFEMEPLSIDFGQVILGQTKDATITIRNTGRVPFSVCAGTGGGAVTFVGTTASCVIGSEDEFVNFSAKSLSRHFRKFPSRSVSIPQDILDAAMTAGRSASTMVTRAFLPNSFGRVKAYGSAILPIRPLIQRIDHT